MKSNSTYFNLLASFAYLGRAKAVADRLFALHRSGEANIMIDSGAFTKLNAKENRDWLTLDNYCDFVEKNSDGFEKYVMLDVIGNADASRANYEKMVDRGLRPMFVLTMFDTDWAFLRHAVSINPDICVAGGTRTKGDWLVKRFQDTMKHTDNKARIHALGYTTHPDFYRVPIVSGDSSSWLAQPQRFGLLNVFTGDGGKVMQFYSDIFKGQKMKPEVRRALNEAEITPAQFMDKRNHVGGTSIGMLLSMKCFLKWSQYAWRYNRRLFLALSSLLSIDMLCFVKDNPQVTYEKFLNEFKKAKK